MTVMYKHQCGCQRTHSTSTNHPARTQRNRAFIALAGCFTNLVRGAPYELPLISSKYWHAHSLWPQTRRAAGFTIRAFSSSHGSRLCGHQPIRPSLQSLPRRVGWIADSLWSMPPFVLATGRPHTPESRAKISAANRGRVPWNVGKKHSPETKILIRERTKAVMVERRRKRIEALGMTVEEYEEAQEAKKLAQRAKREAARAAKVYDEEYRGKCRERMKARWQDPEYREKGLKSLQESRAMQTEITRQKISDKLRQLWEENAVRTNRTMPEETRAKISATLRELYADPEYREKFREKIGRGRQRDPEHNRKIADAIRAKWLEVEYKNKTLAGIAVHKDQYAAVFDVDPAAATSRRGRRSSGNTTTTSGPRAPRKSRTAAAKQKDQMRFELQELERMDREMRGEIQSTRLTAQPPGPRQRSVLSERMAQQTKDTWDAIYGDMLPEDAAADQSLHRSLGNIAGLSEGAEGTLVEKEIQAERPGGGEEGNQEDAKEEGAGPALVREDKFMGESEWRQLMEQEAMAQEAAEAERRKQRRIAMQRLVDIGKLGSNDDSLATDAFRLVNGKIAIVPGPGGLVSEDRQEQGSEQQAEGSKDGDPSAALQEILSQSEVRLEQDREAEMLTEGWRTQGRHASSEVSLSGGIRG